MNIENGESITKASSSIEEIIYSTILCLTYLLSILSYPEFDPNKWMRAKVTWSMHQNINYKASFISPCWCLYLIKTKDLV